jgi:hypothetical protein
MRLQLLLEDACELVRKFKDRSYFFKAWKHNADREAFADFNGRISQAIQDLQLGMVVEIQRYTFVKVCVVQARFQHRSET